MSEKNRQKGIFNFSPAFWISCFFFSNLQLVDAMSILDQKSPIWSTHSIWSSSPDSEPDLSTGEADLVRLGRRHTQYKWEIRRAMPDSGFNRTVSEYCSARVSRVGLSTKQATEPYSDNLLNCTRNPSELCSDKATPLRRALRWLLS